MTTDESILTNIFYRYRHLDHLFSGSKEHMSIEWLIISDMWSAVKSAYMEREAQLDAARCHHPDIKIAGVVMHCPDCHSTWTSEAQGADPLDELVRYLINSWGDYVKTDDMPNSAAVPTAIGLLDALQAEREVQGDDPLAELLAALSGKNVAEFMSVEFHRHGNSATLYARDSLITVKDQFYTDHESMLTLLLSDQPEPVGV